MSTRPSSRTSPTPPESSRAQLPRPIQMDHYQLTEELGRGAYGQVFKATDTRTGNPVAIKRLNLTGISPDTLANIITEIELLKNLNHRHIVKYIGSFKTREYFCIVLEYMERGALSSVIKRQHNEPFEEAVVAVCIEQVLAGLAYLHQQGVVHRDIKGANILTNREGLVKLADFGVAAKLSGVDEGQDTRDVVGTTYWMAPEVIEMTGVSPASDIWSVGCLAVELLTGTPPYYELQPMPALFRIVQDMRPPLPPNISPEFEAFLIQCFQKDPTKRPSARALLQHPFVTHNRRTLKSTWTRTIANRSRRGVVSDSHTRIDAVVQRILKADGDDGSATSSSFDDGNVSTPSTSEARQLGRSATVDDVTSSHDTSAGAMDAYRRVASYSSVQQPPSQHHNTAAATAGGGGVGVYATTTASSGGHMSADGVGGSTGGGVSSAGGVGDGRRSSSQTNIKPSLSTLLSLNANGSTTPTTKDPSTPADPLVHLLERLRVSSTPAEQDMMRMTGGGGVAAGVGLAAGVSGRSLSVVGVEEGGAPLYGQVPWEVGGGGTDATAARQVTTEVRELVQAMRLPLSVAVEQGPNGVTGWGPGAAEGAPQDTALNALKVLAELLPGSHERLVAFVSEGGHVVVLELLTGDIPWLVMPTLRLILAVMKNTYVLEQWCMMGLVPAVLRFCRPDKPLGFDDLAWRQIRRECAFIIQNMCFSITGPEAGRVLVACQALPALVEFVEAHKSVDPGLTRFGIGCIWFLLEKHRGVSPAVMCRLLAHYGLADRLVSSLREMNIREQSRMARVNSKRTISSGSGSGFDTADSSRNVSMSHADFQDDIMDSMCKLLLVLAHADTAVKEQVCRLSTLKTMLGVIEGVARLQPEPLLLRSVGVVRALSRDPNVLPALDQAGTIPALMPLLVGVPVARSYQVQLEVLHTFHNLCKLKSDRARREVAAKAGIIPVLVHLAAPPGIPDYDPAGGADSNTDAVQPVQEELRQLAVPLLCLMTQPGNIEKTRGMLKQAGALGVLLDLLQEEVWQHNAMEALANWLAEDPYDLQKELCIPNALGRFVVLFKNKIASRDVDQLTKLLGPFLRITKTSPQFTVEIAQHGFVPVVLELLKKQHAPAQRDLLSIIHVIYEHYPRPKELIVKYRLQEHLKLLTTSRRGDAAVLVQTQAQRLLDAFQINMVL